MCLVELVAGGLPLPFTDHATKVASFALDMLAALKEYNAKRNQNVRIRVGIHTGPCVAGIMGSKRFSYDIIGEAISVATMIESG